MELTISKLVNVPNNSFKNIKTNILWVTVIDCFGIWMRILY